VLVADLDGSHDMTAEQVRRLTDRWAGIGADGVIRVVPTQAAAEQHVRDQGAQARWFMDYRNADGSAAEMCWQRHPGVRGIPAPRGSGDG